MLKDRRFKDASQNLLPRIIWLGLLLALDFLCDVLRPPERKSAAALSANWVEMHLLNAASSFPKSIGPGLFLRNLCERPEEPDAPEVGAALKPDSSCSSSPDWDNGWYSDRFGIFGVDRRQSM